MKCICLVGFLRKLSVSLYYESAEEEVIITILFQIEAKLTWHIASEN